MMMEKVKEHMEGSFKIKLDWEEEKQKKTTKGKIMECKEGRGGDI